MFLVAFVSLSVCNILKKLWMDFDEIFRRGGKWHEEELIRFWESKVKGQGHQSQIIDFHTPKLFCLRSKDRKSCIVL